MVAFLSERPATPVEGNVLGDDVNEVKGCNGCRNRIIPVQVTETGGCGESEQAPPGQQGFDMISDAEEPFMTEVFARFHVVHPFLFPQTFGRRQFLADERPAVQGDGCIGPAAVPVYKKFFGTAYQIDVAGEAFVP